MPAPPWRVSSRGCLTRSSSCFEGAAAPVCVLGVGRGVGGWGHVCVRACAHTRVLWCVHAHVYMHVGAAPASEWACARLASEAMPSEVLEKAAAMPVGLGLGLGLGFGLGLGLG